MASGWFWVNSACLCVFGDFLWSAQLIVVFLIPNHRSSRYLRLGMWFACFGCLCRERSWIPIWVIFLGRSLVWHTKEIWYADLASLVCPGPRFWPTKNGSVCWNLLIRSTILIRSVELGPGSIFSDSSSINRTFWSVVLGLRCFLREGFG